MRDIRLEGENLAMAARYLWTEEPDDEQPGHQDWETYLDRLFTLLLAYALGGVKALDNAPSAKEEDVLGADTTKFVCVPLDVVMRYHARARRTLASLPHASRLAWLLQRDTGRLGEPFQGVHPDAGPGHQGHIRSTGRPLGPGREFLDQGAPAGVTCQAPVGKADRGESGSTRHERWYRAMPSFPARAMQGGAVVPQRPAQVRCDPQRRPSLRDAEPRSQGVSGGEEILRVPFQGGRGTPP